jgi:limonene-1,2-epoxide hydrolase
VSHVNVGEFPIMGTFEVRDGKIARYTDYFADGEIKGLVPRLTNAGGAERPSGAA